MSASPSAAAHISAVWSASPSVRWTSAPCANSVAAAAVTPVRAAVISGVSPLSNAASGEAPAASRRSSISALPFSAASQTGVAPKTLTRVDVGTGGDQQISRVDVVPVRGPVQRGGAVRLGLADERRVGHEVPDGREIPRLDGVDQW